MIKFLRKLSGNRTHIANLATLAGSGMVAAGLNVDPIQVVAAATGSVDAINTIVTTWDAGRQVDWHQVGVGGVLLAAGPVISSFFRELAATKGRLAK